MDSVKFLQNPSRGLVTVARMICELLSEPKSDYLCLKGQCLKGDERRLYLPPVQTACV